jgi:hypothetical protein
MAEKSSQFGYLALKKETTKNTPVIPNTFVPLYTESLTTQINLQDIQPIIGTKSVRYSVLRGQRDHTGDITIIGDPDVAGYFLDMLLTKTSTSGSGPYTHVFGLSNTTDPNSYTLDIARGDIVFRYWGIQASELGIDFNDNEGRINTKVAGVGSFQIREIATVSTTTITLKTDYDPIPNKGLVATDVVRLYKPSTGATLDTTVSSVNVDGITVVLGASAAAFAAGDLIHLRRQTPTYSTPNLIQWTRSEFRFGATASAALSAAHTPVATGSMWSLKHTMNPDEGAKYSGSYDVYSLPRGFGDADLKTRIFFDTPEEQQRYLISTKRACVVRHYVGSAYELRVTFNNVVQGENPVNLNLNEILFNDITWKSTYDTSDGQHFGVTLINNTTTY